MATLNIRRDVTDPYYRYKMPKLLAKIEGKGNGIKTVVVNMSDIAKSLNRPASYPTKYFGCELGAQVKVNEKDDRFIVNGAHDAAKLQDLLDGFIKNFVLCGSCLNPETELIITKDSTIVRDCKACGSRSDVNMAHKLTTYIVKNPPPKETTYTKEVTKSKAADATPDASPSGTPNDSAGEEEDSAVVTDKVRSMDLNGDDFDDDDDEDDPIKAMEEYIEENPNASTKDFKNAAGNLGLKDDKVAACMMSSLFTENVVKELSEKAKLSTLKPFLKSEKCKKAALGGLERLFEKHREALLLKAPIVLKALYDTDFIDEEIFTSWGEKASKKYVDRKFSKEIRDRAEPFLKWLAEAEVESESD